MSGHSKWNNIKNRKGAQDKKRSKDFFMVGRMIRVAVQQGKESNPDLNPALRLAVEKARQVNMPKETVQKAIQRALGKGENGQATQEVMYEGYGPHGIGFLVLAITDNIQRTAGNVKFLFSRNGGSLGGPGSAMYLFRREGGEFSTTMPVELSAEQYADIDNFIDALLEDEDIEDVYTNAVQSAE